MSFFEITGQTKMISTCITASAAGSVMLGVLELGGAMYLGHHNILVFTTLAAVLAIFAIATVLISIVGWFGLRIFMKQTHPVQAVSLLCWFLNVGTPVAFMKLIFSISLLALDDDFAVFVAARWSDVLSETAVYADMSPGDAQESVAVVTLLAGSLALASTIFLFVALGAVYAGMPFPISPLQTFLWSTAFYGVAGCLLLGLSFQVLYHNSQFALAPSEATYIQLLAIVVFAGALVALHRASGWAAVEHARESSALAQLKANAEAEASAAYAATATATAGAAAGGQTAMLQANGATFDGDASAVDAVGLGESGVHSVSRRRGRSVASQGSRGSREAGGSGTTSGNLSGGDDSADHVDVSDEAVVVLVDPTRPGRSTSTSSGGRRGRRPGGSGGGSGGGGDDNDDDDNGGGFAAAIDVATRTNPAYSTRVSGLPSRQQHMHFHQHQHQQQQQQQQHPLRLLHGLHDNHNNADSINDEPVVVPVVPAPPSTSSASSTNTITSTTPTDRNHSRVVIGHAADEDGADIVKGLSASSSASSFSSASSSVDKGAGPVMQFEETDYDESEYEASLVASKSSSSAITSSSSSSSAAAASSLRRDSLEAGERSLLKSSRAADPSTVTSSSSSLASLSKHDDGLDKPSDILQSFASYLESPIFARLRSVFTPFAQLPTLKSSLHDPQALNPSSPQDQQQDQMEAIAHKAFTTTSAVLAVILLFILVIRVTSSPSYSPSSVNGGLASADTSNPHADLSREHMLLSAANRPGTRAYSLGTHGLNVDLHQQGYSDVGNGVGRDEEYILNDYSASGLVDESRRLEAIARINTYFTIGVVLMMVLFSVVSAAFAFNFEALTKIPLFGSHSLLPQSSASGLLGGVAMPGFVVLNDTSFMHPQPIPSSSSSSSSSSMTSSLSQSRPNHGLTPLTRQQGLGLSRHYQDAL